MRTACALVWAVLVTADAQSYEELFRQAAEMSARRDYDGAIERFKAAIGQRPRAPEALSNLGVTYHQAGRYRDAVETMTSVIAISPDLYAARLVLGIDLVRLNRPQEAIPHLRIALRIMPSSSEAALGLAAAYVGAGEFQSAADVYEAQTSTAPGNADSLYGLAICYERMAEAASRRLSNLPGSAKLQKQFLTEFLIDRGEIRLADETRREAAALEASEPPLQARRVYEEARRLASRSRDAFLRLVDVAPDTWQSELFLADLSRQQRKFTEAIMHYERVDKAIPQSAAAKLGLATVYWELGQFEESEKYLQQVLKINPRSAQGLFELGNIRVRQHREREAVPLLKSFLAVEPGSLSACADLGRAYYHLGRYEEALVYLKRARTIDLKGDIHYQIAAILRRLGRDADAEKSLSISTELRTQALLRQQRLTGATARID